MGRLGIIGGHAIAGSEELIAGAERRTVSTEGGEVGVLESERWVLVQRHGIERYSPAYEIDHAANLQALTKLRCDRLISIGSVGSLRASLAVGTFVCPDDFIALHVGLSSLHGRGGERVPGFDEALRGQLIAAWELSGAAAAAGELRLGGTYWQAIGPRFETPAEIRLIAAHAELIGMTLGSECVVAGELGLPCAPLCVVDNLANGIGETALTEAEFEAGKEANRARVVAALKPLIASLASGEAGTGRGGRA